MPTEKEKDVLHRQNAESNPLEMHNQAQRRSATPVADGRRIQPGLSAAMNRPGLFRQICPPIGLALLVAFGLIAVAIPVLFIRLIVAVAVDGITWK